MRFLMLGLIVALIAGGIFYHAEISDYIDDLADASSGSGGGSSVIDSVRGAGAATSGAMGKVGEALNR